MEEKCEVIEYARQQIMRLASKIGSRKKQVQLAGIPHVSLRPIADQLDHPFMVLKIDEQRKSDFLTLSWANKYAIDTFRITIKDFGSDIAKFVGLSSEENTSHSILEALIHSDQVTLENPTIRSNKTEKQEYYHQLHISRLCQKHVSIMATNPRTASLTPAISIERPALSTFDIESTEVHQPAGLTVIIRKNGEIESMWGNLESAGGHKENSKLHHLFPSKLKEKASSALKRVFQGSVPHSFEFSKHVNEESSYFESLFVKISDDQALVTINDITNRRKSFVKLRENEARFRAIYDQSPVGVAIIDLTGKFKQTNNKLSEILGFSQEELLQREFFSSNDAKQIEEALFYLKRFKKSEIESVLFEKEYKHKDGSPITINLNLSLIREAKEKDYFIAIFEDITQQKRSQQRIMRSEKEYRALVETMNEGIIKTDIEGEILFVNDRICEFLGLRRLDLLGSNIKDLPIFDGTKTALLREKVKSIPKGLSEVYEINCKTKSGESIWLLTSSAPTYDHEGKVSGCIYIKTNVTDMKLMEKRLLQAIDIAQENERKRIATDLHDGLGQTLTAINLNVSALDGFSQHLDENGKVLYNTIVQLVKQSISETRIISKNLMPTTLEKFGLGQSVKELINSINTLEQPTKIKLRNNLKDIRLDPKIEIMIFRIVQEIINNVMKHADANQLVLRLRKSKNFIHVFAEDDGKGFDTTNEKKVGIGLNSMKNRIRSIHGSMVLESNPGSGTKIDIKVPTLESSTD